MFPYNYALEKLSNAVRILATGEGDVRSRLLPAFLEFHTLRAEYLPPSLQADFEWILNELQKRKPVDDSDHREWQTDGTVQANLRRMQNRTGRKIAQKICDLEYRVRTSYDEWLENLRRGQNNSTSA